MARAEDGTELDEGYDENAWQWCAQGAIEYVAGQSQPRLFFDGVQALGKALRGKWAASDVSQFNDSSTHADVLKLFDLAIHAEAQREHT